MKNFNLLDYTIKNYDVNLYSNLHSRCMTLEVNEHILYGSIVKDVVEFCNSNKLLFFIDIENGKMEIVIHN